ncbi:MAG: hypothetical protein CL678_13820 [Bdellovibrionaceae bacterium]|nr:hypothetical protein [Pseudobdellovibrionaceae bacterium]
MDYYWLGVPLFLWGIHRLLAPKHQSQFKKKESYDPSKHGEGLGNATLKRPQALPGIVIDAPAHEILGVPMNASPEEIKKAHRELMKQYHPDKIASPGSPQWEEAQKIASAINDAKKEMLLGR